MCLARKFCLSLGSLIRWAMARKKTSEPKVGLPTPPADDAPESLNLKIPAALKWRLKIRLLEMESVGKKTTQTELATYALEQFLQSDEWRKAG